jgi:hypothetical protein
LEVSTRICGWAGAEAAGKAAAGRTVDPAASVGWPFPSFARAPSVLSFAMGFSSFHRFGVRVTAIAKLS